MRSTTPRAAATALCLAALGATATPAAGQDAPATQAAKPKKKARIAAVRVGSKRLQVQAGRKVAVAGKVRPGRRGLTARLQVQRRKGWWQTLDRDRTNRAGRYVLRDRARRTFSAPARVRVSGARHPKGRRLGRLEVYRWAHASWYGPGLYGNPLGCGGTLYPGRLGVAHKTLPCGTRLTLRHRGRTVRTSVIDRGPYIPGREYDLTQATAQRLGFSGHGPILVTR